MKFNPQMLMQMLGQRNPQLMAQFQQFQQMMASNQQLQNQYRQFRRNIDNNPQAQNAVMQEMSQKIGMPMPCNVTATAKTQVNGDINING